MDIQLGMTATPVMMFDKHYTLIVSTGIHTVYARAYSQQTIQYVVTRAMIVVTLTADRSTAEYSAGVISQR